jgi:exopolysaccharide biosynthesis predicted pyruvyltransferase EpsI
MNEINIFEFLKSYKDKKIIYIINPGNIGDGLISYGTFNVFDKVGLDYTISHKPYGHVYENKILFYAAGGNTDDKNRFLKRNYANNEIVMLPHTIFFGGGGNLIGLYKNCYKFLKRNIKKHNIVLLPHTIKDEDGLIKRLDDNVKIICREVKSYQYVRSVIRNKNNVFISKDMAFYINNIDEYKIRKGTGTGNCFRTDVEKTDIVIPQNNKDISIGSISYKLSKEEIISRCLKMLEYLSRYEIINTNRLHVAIAGALLDRKVNLWCNNYWKNKEVYEYTLKKYKNVVWCTKKL